MTTTHWIRIRLLPLALIFFSGVVLTGCGKKGLPRPIRYVPPPPMEDLEGRVQAQGVRLSWSAGKPDPDDRFNYCFSVQRARIGAEEERCPTCPPLTQRELVCLDPANPRPAVMQNGRMIWEDREVPADGFYRYQVVARDSKRPLAYSNAVTLRVLPPPPSPLDLAARSEPDGVILAWRRPPLEPRSSGSGRKAPLHFWVERRSGDGAWERISPVPVEDENFVDSVVTPGKLYDYRVTSVLLSEPNPIPGGFAEVSEVRAPATPESLPPPHTVWVVPAQGSLEVHWTEVDQEVKGYHVYRRQGGEITRLTADPVDHPPYLDRHTRPNAVYFYAVSVVGAYPPYTEGLTSKWIEMKSHVFPE